MSALSIIVTNAGRAALVNAQHNGTAPVLIASVGVSPTAIVASAATTAIAGELKRIATLSGQAVAADTIHLVVRDESADSYTMRSFGLYLGDGTLFAVYSQAGPLIEKSVQSMLLLALDIRFVDIAAANLSFGNANFLNPPATTEMLGVVELATDAEADAGTDAALAVTPKAMRSAVTSWINSRFGAGAPSAFVKALLTAASAAAMRISLGLGSAATRNEGAGGGLDADLLDGQHGAYYADVPARLGYVPWGPSNDGSGSGLDADTVDGRQAAEFALLTGAAFSGAISAGVGAAGRVTLAFGDANYTGHVEFWTGNGVRRGFVGFVGPDGYLRYTSEGSGHLFMGDVGFGVAPQAGYALSIGHASDLRQGLIVGSALVGQLQALPSAMRVHAIGPRSAEIWTNGTKRFAIDADGTVSLAGVLMASKGIASGGAGTDGFIRFDRADNATNLAKIEWLSPTNLLAFQNNNGGGFAWTVNGAEVARLTPAGRLIAKAGIIAGGDIQLTVPAGGNTVIDHIIGGNIVVREIASINGYTKDATYHTLRGKSGEVLYAQFGPTGASFPLGLSRAGNQVWDAGNDGAGSGLDADLLDGQDGSYYANIVARLGYTPLDSAAYTAADIRAKLLTVDGAGSGLDADLLDGHHASAFVLASDVSINFAQPGYAKLPGGLVLQWVRGASGITEASQWVSFPLTFTSIVDAWVSTSIPSGSTSADVWFQMIGDPAVNGCSVMRGYSGNVGMVPGTPVIFAIGKI